MEAASVAERGIAQVWRSHPLSAIELAKSFNAEKEKTTQPVITVRIESLLFFRSASMQAHRLRGVLDNVLDCGLESSQGFASAKC